MKSKSFAALVLLTSFIVFAACDDNTDEIGTSLIDNFDDLEVMTDTFEITTQSIIADSVYSRNTVGYLGKVRDPETGAYVTSDFMTQFHTLYNTSFPDQDTIVSRNSAGEIIADSCRIVLYFEDFYGDSLATMKLTVEEMSDAMQENVIYYSNFDPEEEGLIREDGLSVDRIYTLVDYNVADSLRWDESYLPYIRIKLDKEYTDTEGNTYNNYGTYLIYKYFENPDNFTDTYKFIHNICPGFYIKTTGGLGSMAYIGYTHLMVHFRYIEMVDTYDDDDELVYDDDGNVVQEPDTVNGYVTFAGTEEVLLCSKITNDDNTIEQLAADNTCTYLKTPAGIFTEITLPVDDMLSEHDNDTVNTAKIVLTRINNTTTSEYALDIPQTLLLIRADELYSFFENSEVADYKYSFIASYSDTYNTYTFNNIGTLVKDMYENGDRSTDTWNKVVVIPVTTTYNSSSVLTKVSHDMSLGSTKLVGGSENPYKELKASLIYSKFK